MVTKSGELAGAQKSTDSTKETPDQSSSTESPLRQQVDAALAGPPKADDKTKVTDQAETTKAASAEPDDPYSHTNRVKRISEDLVRLQQSGKGPEDTIQVGDKHYKVKDVVTEMKRVIESEIEAGKKAAAAIDQDIVGVMINQNIQDRNRLARDLGLDPTKLTTDLIESERAKAGSDPARSAKFDELVLNLQDRGEMEKLRHAPAYIKLVEAEMTAKGHNDPKLGLNDEASPDAIRKAFDLLKLAGNEDPDLKTTDIYSEIEQGISLTFAVDQQERSQDIIRLMQAATEAGKTGQKQTVMVEGQQRELSQEDLLKEANRLADKINVGWVGSQALLPRNIESGISTELMNIVYVSSHARLDYVNYMAEHGQIKEAQTLFNRVKTDTPELIYDEKGGYRDASLQRLDNKLTLGVSTDGADFQTAQSSFLEQLEKGNLHRDRNKPGQSAGEVLDQMKALNTQFRREMEESDKVLNADKQRLIEEKTRMEKNQTPSEAEKMELERVKREIQVIDATMQQRHSYLNRRENLTTYMEASFYDAKEDYSKAHSLYKQFEANETDSELKKQLNIEDKLAQTQPGFKGWWNRNWSYVAVGASIVVAAGLTVGTLGLGSAVGAGLVATALTATAVGTGGAALTHWGIERTVNKDAGWESAWKGAKVGLMTSGMIVAPWATGARAAAATGATTIGAEGAAVSTAANASNVSKILGAARAFGAKGAEKAATLGITKNSLAAGFGVSAITTTGDAIVEGRTFDQAASQFVKDGAVNTLMFGMASNIAVAKEALTAARTTNPLLTSFKVHAGLGFGTSAIAEGNNYINGTKTGGEATLDFLTGGAVNTAAIHGAGRLGFGQVGRYANPYIQASRYGAHVVAMEQSFMLTGDRVGHYLSHDILGQGVLPRDGGASFLTPLAANTSHAVFGGGLNEYHSGEAKRIAGNARSMSDHFSASIYVDQKFVQPKQINRQGMFFNLDDLIKRDQQQQ